MKNRIICIICVLFCIIFNSFSESIKDYVKEFKVTVLKELKLKNNSSPSYGYEGYVPEVGPIYLTYTENDQYIYFDQVGNIGRVFDSHFNHLKNIDYKIKSRLPDSDLYYAVFIDDRVVIGQYSDFTDKQDLEIYKENLGLIGYYQFIDDSVHYRINNSLIYILGDYAFYFKEKGVVEWLERPLSKSEIDEKKYLSLKKSSKDLSENKIFTINSIKYELSPNGVLYKNDIVYEKIAENLNNALQEEKFIVSYSLKYLTTLDNKIYWKAGDSIIITDYKLNVLAFIPINVAEDLKVEMENLKKIEYNYCLAYNPENGFTLFAREYKLIRQEGGSVHRYGSTYICKVTPLW